MARDLPLTLSLATSGLHGEVGLALADGTIEIRALGQGAARGMAEPRPRSALLS